MQRKLLLFCTCFIIATSATIRAQGSGIGTGGGVGPGVKASWRTYTVKDEEFSVSLPMLPAMMTSDGQRKADGKRRLERVLKTYHDGIDYHVEAFENPEPRQSLEQFIAEEGLISRYDRSTERKLTINGYAGLEYSSLRNATPARAQFFATEKHVYRFVTNGPDAGKPQVGTMFFSSIKLGKNLEGMEVSDGPGNSTAFWSPTGERVFTGREVDTKARLIKKVEPIYTDEARNNQVSGVVILKVILSKTGEVINIRVVSGLPYGLTQRAIDAARGIQFTPAIKDGKPVSMWMQLEYNFNL